MTTSTVPTRSWILAAMFALGACLLAAPPAHASGATSAVCTSQFNATFIPGFSTTPRSGTATTHGQTGSFSCVGKIDGARVTGPGSLGFEESYTGNCLGHIGIGTVRVLIPTTGGTKEMIGALHVRRTALAVHPKVQFPDARFDAVGIALPTQGTCFLTPLRRALITVSGALS